MNLFSLPSRFESVCGATLWAGGLALLLATGAVRAQAPIDAATEAEMNASNWTGRLESPAIARKEAGAALVEGRRACARERQREARAACLETVLADYDKMIKRAGRKPAARSN